VRALFHYTPRVGWMNDPNGLIELGGTHHLFYQHHPYSTSFGSIHWGHATSTDLVHWTEQPIALTPGDSGDYDAGGCFSGCVVRRADGAVAAIYSGHTHAGELPCIAWADDDGLIRWTKSAKNPVIAQRPDIPGITDFRDHTVRREAGGWVQRVAARGDSGGAIAQYSSADLEDWRYEGIFLSAAETGLPAGGWECPDVFADGVTEVTVYSRYDGELVESLWTTGRIEGGRFLPQRYGLIDHGDRYYAPQSYRSESGRRIMFGWVRTHLDPASPEQENAGAQSLPRVVAVDRGLLVQTPAAELDALRGESRRAELPPATTHVELDVVPARALEIVIESPRGLELAIVDEAGHRCPIDLSVFDAPLCWDRVQNAWAPRDGVVSRIRLLIDNGIIEAFTDDGRAATFTDLGLAAVATVSVVRTATSRDDHTIVSVTRLSDQVRGVSVSDQGRSGTDDCVPSSL
jgi:beta-fructofuranosidase